MRRLSLVSVLSDKVRDGGLIVVDEMTVELGKTAGLLEILDALGVEAPAMIVAAELDPSVLRATKNIKRLKSLPVSLLNTLDLINHGKVVITVDAVRRAEELWGGSRRRRRRLAQAAV
jgi:large subunit ribosomal protein L4